MTAQSDVGAVADTASCALSAIDISHRFGRESLVLDGVDLNVRAGDFCTILGPSGSGKTTLLRAIAGLIRPDAGRIWIDGSDVTEASVQSRNIGFVFQNYALFPHLTVQENVAYSLKVRGQARKARAARSLEMLELVDLVHLRDRLPGELSGGQQQRVAIARALAFSPTLMLLDEPLGALDRRLRQRLGSELRRIQQATGVTALYVTHDQEEAFLLSDHVVVMRKGVIAQEGRPTDLYTAPRDEFVARFLGDSNILPATLIELDALATAAVEIFGSKVVCRVAGDPDEGPCLVSVRPEDIVLTLAKSHSESADVAGFSRIGQATVVDVSFRGDRYRLAVSLPDDSQQLMVDVNRNEWRPDAGKLVDIHFREEAAVAIPG